MWRGVRLDKYPQDLLLYSEVIFKRRPDFIVETGTFYGGSALFFADMLRLIGGKKVFSIDNRKDRNFPYHPLVEYVNGSSVDSDTIGYIKSKIGGKVMVSLDSDHRTHHVLKELEMFAPIVTKGQYMAVEDAYSRSTKPDGPYYAIEKFLTTHKEFRMYNLEKKYVFGLTKGGWLRKIL
jgi:cephalosporin hydroxylase